jgi:glycosyltransferase involved in cell wall biosynthesis
MWEQGELLLAARDGVLLNLLSSGPLIHPRQISTFHDAAVLRMPELFSKGYRALHTRLRPALARRSAGLITVSNFSAGELSELLGVPRERFVIAPNAADHIAREESQSDILELNGLTPGRYALCVGNQTPNKNIATAMQAFLALKRPDLRLAIVGAGDADVFGVVKIAEHPSIVRLGYINDGQLRALYEAAAFLCFPSLYEGFGIPVLEAMTLGCPVISSNAAALPETCGNAALMASPNDVNSFSNAMVKVLDQPALAADLRRRGLARAATFSWDRAASEVENLLLRVAGEARH